MSSRVRTRLILSFLAALASSDGGSVAFAGLKLDTLKRLQAAPSDDVGVHGFAVGDFNGDGFSDFAHGGAKRFIMPFLLEYGAVYVHDGGPSGLSVAPSMPFIPDEWVGNELSPFAGNFGGTLAALGDIDGDGFDDLAAANEFGVLDDEVKAYQDAYVFRGGPGGLSRSRYFQCKLPLQNVQSVGRAGDVNGDGMNDWFTLSRSKSLEDAYQVLSIYHGAPAAMLSSYPDLSIKLEGMVGSQLDGVALGLGDVDGNGYDDVGFGNPVGKGGKGMFEVFWGSATGLQADSRTEVIPPATANLSGLAVSAGALGDIDSDGFADFVLNSSDPLKSLFVYGGPGGFRESKARPGRAYPGGDTGGNSRSDFVLLSTWGLRLTEERDIQPPLYEINAVQTSMWFGDVAGDAKPPPLVFDLIAGGGDFNGDGFDDLVVSVNTLPEQMAVVLGQADDRDGDGASSAQDCDDNNPAIHIGAEDPPDDGIDGDCDGQDRHASTPPAGCGVSEPGGSGALGAWLAVLALLARRTRSAAGRPARTAMESR